MSVSWTISIEKYQVDQLFCLCLRKKNVQMEEVVGGGERESVCVCVCVFEVKMSILGQMCLRHSQHSSEEKSIYFFSIFCK